MINMATHASRNTTTGMAFEEKVSARNIAFGEDVSKHALYRFLKARNINWEDLISRKLLPDEAYWDEENKTLTVFEKKTQNGEGSADEKIQTCGFKILQYKKIGLALGAEKVTYTYILDDWFKAPRYKDVLDYIKSIEDCDYTFSNDL